MSSLKFDAEINTTKLDEGLKQANQSFAEFSKSAVKSGQVVDQSFQKSTENLKQQVAQQKQLIKEIENDIKNMSAERDKMSRTQDKSNANADIGAAKRALAEENGRLLDLQKAQIAGNQQEEQSQGSLIGSLGKWAMGLATVAAAMKIGKSIIESTEATAHVFEIGINAASSATGVFFKTVASGDWGNFFSNMDRAIQGAITYTNAMEDLNNRANQIKISGSKLDVKIGELRQKTYEQADDPKALKETLTKLVTLQREKLTDEAGLASDAYKIKANKIASDNGWNIKDLQQTIEFYSEKKDIIQKGEEYNRLTAIKYKQGSTGGSTMIGTAGNEIEYNAAQASLKLMREEAAITKTDLEAAGKLAENFSKVTFKERDLVADLLSKSNAATAAIDINNRRDNQRISTIDVQIKKDAIAAAKKAKEDAELDNRIKATQELMKTANGAELAGLAQKLVALEAEKKLREDIIKLAVFSAKYDATYGGITPTTMTSKTGQEVTSKLALKIDAKQAGNDLVDTTKKFIKDKEKQGSDLVKSEADRIKKQTDDLANGFYTASDAAAQLAKNIGDSNPALTEIINGVGSLANEMGNLIKAGAFTKDGMTTSDAISASISGATQLIGIVAGQAAENKRVMDEYYKSTIAQQQEYNLLLNDQLRLNSDIHSSVFLKDYEGTLNDSTKAYNDAQSKLAEEQKKFLNSEAITGKKSVISGSNVLGGIGAGAATGAGIGALLGGGILSLPAAVGGAIIGGVVGLFTGLFAKKKKDIVAPLLETYPDLIKANGEFNADLAKTLIANNKVTDATKQTLQNMIDWKDAADAATAQLKSVISDLTGSLGDGLRTALVTAFTDGTDAAQAFKGEVNKVLENIMSNMIFNRAFEGAFKSLEDSMAADPSQEGWTKALGDFYSKYPDLIKKFNTGLTDAQAAAAKVGLDVFQPTGAAAQTGMSGTIARSITEETGSEISGLLRRGTDDTRIIRDYTKMGIANLTNIEKNTFETVLQLKLAVVELQSIVSNTKSQPYGKIGG